MGAPHHPLSGAPETLLRPLTSFRACPLHVRPTRTLAVGTTRKRIQSATSECPTYNERTPAMVCKGVKGVWRGDAAQVTRGLSGHCTLQGPPRPAGVYGRVEQSPERAHQGKSNCLGSIKKGGKGRAGAGHDHDHESCRGASASNLNTKHSNPTWPGLVRARTSTGAPGRTPQHRTTCCVVGGGLKEAAVSTLSRAVVQEPTSVQATRTEARRPRPHAHEAPGDRRPALPNQGTSAAGSPPHVVLDLRRQRRGRHVRNKHA